MNKMQKCHTFLSDAYRAYDYVSTPLLQAKFGVSYFEARKILAYAEERGWIAPKDESDYSFRRGFIREPPKQKKLGPARILEISHKINDPQIDFLLKHVGKRNGFSKEEAEAGKKPAGLSGLAAIRSMVRLDYLYREKLLIDYEDMICVTVDEESIKEIQRKKHPEEN